MSIMCRAAINVSQGASMEDHSKIDLILTALVLLLAAQIKAKKTTTSDCVSEAVDLIRKNVQSVLKQLG
jgi:hypothetical protein